MVLDRESISRASWDGWSQSVSGVGMVVSFQSMEMYRECGPPRKRGRTTTDHRFTATIAA